MFKNFSFAPLSPPTHAVREPPSPSISPLTLCPTVSPTDLPTPPLSPRSLSPDMSTTDLREQTLSNTLELMSLSPPLLPSATIRQHRQQLSRLQTTDQQTKYLKALTAFLESSSAVILPSPPEYDIRAIDTAEEKDKERRRSSSSCTGPVGVSKRGCRRDARDRRSPRRGEKARR